MTHSYVYIHREDIKNNSEESTNSGSESIRINQLIAGNLASAICISDINLILSKQH